MSCLPRGGSTIRGALLCSYLLCLDFIYIHLMAVSEERLTPLDHACSNSFALPVEDGELSRRGRLVRVVVHGRVAGVQIRFICSSLQAAQQLQRAKETHFTRSKLPKYWRKCSLVCLYWDFFSFLCSRLHGNVGRLLTLSPLIMRPSAKKFRLFHS